MKYYLITQKALRAHLVQPSCLTEEEPEVQRGHMTNEKEVESETYL